MKNIFFYKDKNFHQIFIDFLKTRQKPNTEIISLVAKVIEDVRINKDAALIKYTKKFDNVDLRKVGIFFLPNEIEESIGKIDLLDRKAIDLSIGRIMDFHKKQI